MLRLVRITLENIWIMENLKSISEAISALSQRLGTIYRPYSGAQFRLAFYCDSDQKQFLTGRVMFSEKELPARAAANYGKLLFVEHWCSEPAKVVDVLSQLLSGQAEIGGCRIEGSFNRSDFDHRPYPSGAELWTGWQVTSARDHDSNWKEVYVPQGRLTARGLKSYRGPDEAINDWIWGIRAASPYSSDIPYKDKIVIILPDTRGRILEAEWQASKLHLKLEINIAPEQVELQVRHEDSSNEFQLVQIKPGLSEVEVAIPDDARALSILLLDDLGKPISEVTVEPQKRVFGKGNAHSLQSGLGATLLDSAELADVPELPPDFGSEDYYAPVNSNDENPVTPSIQKAYSPTLPQRQGEAAMATAHIALFISHSSVDKKIAEILTEVVKNSLEIEPDQIRCTSVEGHRLRGGVDTDEQLRQELLESECFIGLLTPQSLSSTYVLFELGARWGAERHLVPLLAAGLQHKDLRGPLTGKHGHSCDVIGEVHQLVDELAESLKIRKRPVSNYEKYVQRLVQVSKAQGKKATVQRRPKSGQTLQEARRQRFIENMAKLETPERDVLFEFVLDGCQMMPPKQNDLLLKYGHSTYKGDPIAAIETKAGFMRGTFHGHYEVNSDFKSFLEEWADTYSPSSPPTNSQTGK
jgi:hypothetical protein